ncbi:MAG: 3'-5' exonuclease, partial [Planctomycetota bacterium]
TLTNKAAGEVLVRVDDLLEADGLWVSTFHSMGARMLRRSADRLGYEHNFSIYSDDDQQRIVRDVIRDLNVDSTQFRPAAVRAAISRLKTNLVSPEKARGRAHDFFSEVVANVYPGYERRLRESNAMDFDDLLVKTLELLTNHEDVAGYYQHRFQFVLVDEYQDTNRVQFLLMRTLTEPQRNIHATGDPDQSIYRFRGADIRNILDFEKDYPETKIIRLEENFRSTGHILAGADSLIRHNKDRKAKALLSTRENGTRIRLHTAEDEEEEGRIIADTVLRAYERGIPYSDVAIFYRVHALSRSVEKAFIDRGIPYMIVRGTEFFRRAEVLDLLAYLKVVSNPRDTETLLRILNVPARGIGDTTRDRLVAFAREHELPLLEAARRVEEAPGITGRSRKAVIGFTELFGDLTGASAGPVAALIERIVSSTDYAAWLKARYPDNHEDRWENVSQLVASAAEFQAKGDGRGLPEYLEEVSLLSDADQNDRHSARVPLMTLHTAKGLEYKTVVVAGLEEGLLPHSRSRDSKEDLEEERRLLFVGMTRAREELHLTNALQRYQWGQSSFSTRSRFLKEIADDSMRTGEAPSFLSDRTDREYGEPAAPAPDDGEDLAVGMKVRHGHFGVGRVVDLTGSGPSSRVVVDFTSYGRKKLVKMYAKLVPVGNA